MHKLFIAILYFGLISCGHQKTEQISIDQTALNHDTVSAATTKAPNKDYATTFKANKVTETGKVINGIFQDSNDNYWFASNGEGAYCYDGKTLIQFTTKDGLPDNQVFNIQEDPIGNIWMLTIGGISRFDGKSFTTYPNNGHQAVINGKDFKMNPDDLWFETGSGAYSINGNSISYLPLPNSDVGAQPFNLTNPQKPDARKLTANSVYCSLKDSKGNIWMGTQTMGVCYYDGKSFTWLTEKGLSGPAVRALFEDRHGNLWFGNNGNGLFRYDGKNLINFTDEKGLGNPEFLKTGKSSSGTMARVWTVNEDNIGNLWIGTYDSGVWRYDGKNLTNFTTKDGLTSNAINTLFKDKTGELWIGTDGKGVCKYDGTSFSVFTVQ